MTYFNNSRLTTKEIDAINLFDAANSIQLKENGIDFTDVLRLQAGGITKTQEALTGISNTGTNKSFERIGRVMTGEKQGFVIDALGRKVPRGVTSPDWGWVRLGTLKGFGLTRSVYVPGYTTSDGRTVYLRQALYQREWEEQARDIYQNSSLCRADDFDFHVSQVRGAHLAFELAKFLKSEEMDYSVRYQRNWINTWLMDNGKAEYNLLDHMDQAGVFSMA